jgi:hypothetical protein
LSTLALLRALPPSGLACRIPAADGSSPRVSQLTSMLSDAVYLLSTMNHEELVMTIICFFPLMYGTLAFLSTFAGGAAAP